MKKRTLSYLVTLTLLDGTLTSARADEPNLTPPSVELTPVSDSQTRQQQFLLSGLWAFATFNYLYCDVVGLMDAKLLAQYATGTVNGMRMSEQFLLVSTLLMQIPISMVVLSSVLGPKPSRIANIAAGVLMTLVQAATLFVGRPTSSYLASSVIEIATTSFITVYSAFFFKVPTVVPTVQASRDAVSVGLRVTF